MRKLTFLLSCIISINLGAQNLRFGISVDPIVSWFSPGSKHIKKDGSGLGYNIGLTMEKYFMDNYAFATGISITGLSANLLYEDSVNIQTDEDGTKFLQSNSTVDYALQYITIPVSLKLRSNQIGYITYFARAGMDFQVNVKASADATDRQLEKDNVNKEISLLNFSFFLGGGIEYSLGGTTALEAGLFFNNGFLDVLNNKSYKGAINYLSLRLGIMF
jgi:hypothetical protein